MRGTGRPRLLVVGASPIRAGAFGVWRELGIEIVLVDGHSMGRYEDLAHEFHGWSAEDGSADLTRLRELAATCQGVTTLTDDSQLTAATLAAELDLPGVGPDAAAAARSKALQRARCQAAGMVVPRWRAVRGDDDITAFYAGGPCSAVLKPVDGAGGVGALRVENAEQALRHWPIVRSLSRSRTAVIEEFLDGREVCVDTVVVDGEPLYSSIVDCEHLTDVGFLCVAARYRAGGHDQRSIDPVMREVIAALDVDDGIVHGEFKFDGGRWVTVEVGLRPGGALVPELTVVVSGVDLYAAQAQVALGREPDVTGREPVADHAESRHLVADGQVRRFVPPATVLAGLDDVRVVVQQSFAGQQTRVPLSEAGRAGYAYGWGPDSDRLDAQLCEAIDRLGTGMGVTIHGNHRLTELPDDSALAAV